MSGPGRGLRHGSGAAGRTGALRIALGALPVALLLGGCSAGSSHARSVDPRSFYEGEARDAAAADGSRLASVTCRVVNSERADCLLKGHDGTMGTLVLHGMVGDRTVSLSPVPIDRQRLEDAIESDALKESRLGVAHCQDVLVSKPDSLIRCRYVLDAGGTAIVRVDVQDGDGSVEYHLPWDRT